MNPVTSALASAGGGSMISLEGVELSAVLSEVQALVPKVLPAIIGFIALRKGISFIKSSLKGA